MTEPRPADRFGLAELPLFRGVPPPALARISASCRSRTYAAGGTVFRAGEPSRAFYAIRSGGVRLFRTAPDGRIQVVHQLRAGQTFAEAAVLTMKSYPASAEAMESPTELVEIDGETFRRVFREDEQVAAAMVASLSGWLLRLVERVHELTAISVGARVARYLLRQPAKSGADGLVIELPLAKKDLARQLAITPETLSRLLARWRADGVADARGRSVVVLAPDRLEAIAEEG